MKVILKSFFIGLALWGMAQPAAGSAETNPSWIIGENQMARFEADVRREGSNPERVAADYARSFAEQHRFMTLDQLGQILAIAKLDVDRQKMLRVLGPVVDQRYGSMANALRSYQNDVNRYEARQILSYHEEQRSIQDQINRRRK